VVAPVETSVAELRIIADRGEIKPESFTRVVEVSTKDPYQVLIGRGLKGKLVPELGRATKVAILHPAGLSKMAIATREVVEAAGPQVVMVPLPDGEAAKKPAILSGVWRTLANENFTRTDLVIGLGGGATTDLAGFAAASFLRGIDWIAMPTTVLGMVDAAIGGKTAIDLPEGKNLVGAFHEPKLVLCDLDALAGLPEREVRSGLAEVVKCGFCADAEILRLIAENPAEAVDVTSPRFAELVLRAVVWKAGVVADDLYEEVGVSRLGREALNYGHTMGHAVEAQQKFRLRHGEAVSIGMVFAAELAARTVGLGAPVVQMHRDILESLGLPTRFDKASFEELRELMSRDKKARGGQLRFVLLHELGDLIVLADPAEDALADSYAAIS
jgi:3-dehydroquinate synthase